MAEKKVLIVGHGPAGIAAAEKILEESEDSLIVIADSPGGSIGGPPPVLDVESITFIPKYFPPSKSKYHK